MPVDRLAMAKGTAPWTEAYAWIKNAKRADAKGTQRNPSRQRNGSTGRLGNGPPII